MKRFILLLCLLLNSSMGFAINFDSYNLDDINSVRKITKDYKKEFKNKKGSIEAEKNFNRFIEIYTNFEDIQNKNIYLPYKLSNNSISLQVERYSKKYYKYGLIVQFDEGEYLLAKSNKYIYENFAEYLSKPFQEYLEYNKSDERIISDGRYIISREELNSRIKFYESFVKLYPKFAEEYKLNDKIKYLKEDLKHYPSVIY
ncbi:hypothetical protein IJ472_01360 [bacterium]|nr:hypothetical protein [bacterium]